MRISIPSSASGQSSSARWASASGDAAASRNAFQSMQIQQTRLLVGPAREAVALRVDANDLDAAAGQSEGEDERTLRVVGARARTRVRENEGPDDARLPPADVLIRKGDLLGGEQDRRVVPRDRGRGKPLAEQGRGPPVVDHRESVPLLATQ